MMQHVTLGLFGNYAIPLPPISEQKAIADFLDKQCAEIDAVIEQTKATIEEYKKLKQSVITEAVTKGIRGDRPMKDSGIEWIRQLPIGWESTHPKALFTLRKDKAKQGEKQLTSSQQYGIVYQDEYMELTGTKIVTVEKDFDILKHVEEGDFVISMRSFQGGLEYSTKSGSISSAYVMLIPNKELVFPRFYRWLFKSAIYINALQSTSNMVRDGQAMRYSNFAQVRLYTVPLDEQEEIADYLDQRCAEIDTLIEKKTALLEEMEALKKSIIFEYVTGKKEVV
jgi:type I restriction enzyme S subunit